MGFCLYLFFVFFLVSVALNLAGQELAFNTVQDVLKEHDCLFFFVEMLLLFFGEMLRSRTKFLKHLLLEELGSMLILLARFLYFVRQERKHNFIPLLHWAFAQPLLHWAFAQEKAANIHLEDKKV